MGGGEESGINWNDPNLPNLLLFCMCVFFMALTGKAVY